MTDTDTQKLQSLHAVKGYLAKILARENIAIRHDPSLSTASFNIKDRCLYLPVWEKITEDLYDLLVVHEVGHALETPWDETEKMFARVAEKYGKGRSKDSVIRSFHGFFNVVEDIRIDQLQRNRYPGSKSNYINGYRELFERGFFGTDKTPIEKMIFIDRLNIHSKAGFSGVVHVPFTAAEREKVKRAMAVKTFAEMESLAVEFWLDEQKNPSNDFDFSIIFEKFGKKKIAKADAENEDSEETLESDESFSINSSDFEDVEEFNAEIPTGPAPDDQKINDELEAEDAEETLEDEDIIEKEDDRENSVGGRGGSEITAGLVETEDEEDDVEIEALPYSTTNDSLTDGVSGLVSEKRKKLTYYNVPVISKDWKKKIVGYKTWLAYHRQIGAPENYIQKQVREFIAAEKTNISFMVKEFEMRKRATAYSKTQVSKTGTIDTNKLHSYMYNDDIFKKNETVPKGKNHGFVLFIDWSGSMSDVILSVLKQAISITSFCRRLQIPYDVYTFTDSGTPAMVREMQPDIGRNIFVNETNDLGIGGYFRVNNILSSRMNPQENEAALSYLWEVCSGSYKRNGLDGMSGTPLNETILLSSEIIADFKKVNKIDIVNAIYLTDGEGGSMWNLVGGSDYILYDNETKEYIPVPNGPSGLIWTNLFLKIVKNRTNANTVGFYVFSGKQNEWVIFQGQGHTYEESLQKRQMLKTEGFCKIEHSGYDDYFYIKNKALNVSQKNLNDVVLPDRIKDRITTKNFSAFLTKTLDEKFSSRVLLKDFIKRIA